jgi:hypothetical protein
MFVQQFRRQNALRAKNSLFLTAQGVAQFSGVVCPQNFGTIRATRPLYRGTLCPEAEPLGFMIPASAGMTCLRFMLYDLKAGTRVVTTRADPICRDSPQRHRDHRGALISLERHDLDFILRALGVSVVDIHANKAKRRLSVAGRQLYKQSQFPATPGGTGPQGRATQGNRAKQTQFRRREKHRQVLGGKGVMVNSTSDRPAWFKHGRFRVTVDRARA